MTTTAPAARAKLPRRGWARAGVMALAVAASAGCRSSGTAGAPGPARGAGAPALAARGQPVSSNILRTDYAGSEACRGCHADVVAAWRRSPMHRMTRLPETAEVRAPFDGRELAFKEDVARFEQVGASRFIRLVSATRGEHLYRVTKIIGGRYREDFAGLEVTSTDAAAGVIGDPRAELILPASYVFPTQSFRLKGYSVMVPERPGLRAGGVWNQTCIFCHNTIPYFDDLWGALHGPGAPGYQGEVVDRVLPERARLAYRVRDGEALLPALDEEIATLGGGAGVATRVAAGARSSGETASQAGLRRAILEA
ncbi:MAG TPA: hypothetical protein VIU64_12865, partial [Polyangia bacterium]